MQRSGAVQPNAIMILCDDLNNVIQGMGYVLCAPAPNLLRFVQLGVHFLSHNYANNYCN
jgi:arylsulfatase A-like enzyme